MPVLHPLWVKSPGEGLTDGLPALADAVATCCPVPSFHFLLRTLCPATIKQVAPARPHSALKAEFDEYYVYSSCVGRNVEYSYAF